MLRVGLEPELNISLHRIFLDREERLRDRALFDLAVDSKLRGCDLVALRLRDIQHGAQIAPRAIITASAPDSS